MTSNVEYRSLTPYDYDELIRVWSESGLSFRPKGRDRRDQVCAEITKHPDLHVGAFADGKMIGSVVGSWDGRRGCINRLAVVPGHRKSGVARELVALCEERLRAHGAKVIFALIMDDNHPSQALFTKLGYFYHDDVRYFSKRDSQED